MSSFTEKLNSKRIPLKDIKDATNNFADENIIQHRGKRKIYKGKLSKSEKLIDVVAVCFDPYSWRGRKEFMKEVRTLCSLKHPNLASIVGFCDEDHEMIIITNLEAKGSLDQHLNDPTLTWTQRLQICLGIAQAISYIYHDKKRRSSFIHSNIKSSKILLDDKWNAKLFGFELSKMQVAARRQGLVLDRFISGTGAYLDPAYIQFGGVTHKSDIYSLGVVLFEVLCGRKACIIHEGKPPTSVTTGSQDLKYQVAKHDEPVTTCPASVAKIKPTSLNQVESSDLEYQARSHDELVRMIPNFSGTRLQLSTNSYNFSSTRLQRSTNSYDGAVSHSDLIAINNSWIDFESERAPGFSDQVDPRKSYTLAEGEEVDCMISMSSWYNWYIPEDGFLANLAKSHYEEKTLDDIILSNLKNQMDSQSLEKFSEAAYCCLNEKRTQRPNIDRVIFALNQALDFQLEHEKREHLRVAVQDRSTSSHLKGKDVERLKIGLDAIIKATDGFSEKHYIGDGGYGVVYKGELEHYDSSKQEDNKEIGLAKKCSMVAIKHITMKDASQGAEEGFYAEIETLSSCKHPNVVSLLGFCNENSRMILVYEYVSNGSLDSYLGKEGKMTNLTWVQRLKICIDIARGLNYIHTTMDKKQKIIHRDIKSANILLNENFEAKIADFGLSRLHSLNQTKSTIITSKIGGTKVYCDPEYARTGNLKKESDVYSFGVVLFEIMTGSLAYEWVTEDNESGLAPIVRQEFESKKTLKDMLDSKLKEISDENGFTLSKGPNKDSLHIFSKIGCQCLSEKQKERPSMELVIQELGKALKFQEDDNESLRITFEDIERATQGFSYQNMIGKGGFGTVYKGKLFLDKEATLIVAKRNDKHYGQGEKEFLTELEILFEYKHKNVISLVGFCDENNERISVIEYACNGSLDRHVNNPSLTWTQRLKIGIDIATGLDFLHGSGGGSTQAFVIHSDIKSANILLDDDWNAKISDFGLSMISAIDDDDEMDFVIDDARGTIGYVDPLCIKHNSVTRESDIYSLGVVLSEIMCGELVYFLRSRNIDLVHRVKSHHEEGNLNELVLYSIKNMIVPASLSAYQSIAYECLLEEREKRPTASDVVSKLKEALRLQEDIDIWEANLPKGYEEIIQMSINPENYSNVSNKELCEMLSEGILLKNGKTCLSVNSDGEPNEMVSATMFSYESKRLRKPISFQNSRFKRVVKILDITNLKIQISYKTQLLSPNVIYGAHLVFKFCDPRKILSKLTYVNLKYKMGSKTCHAYFATCGDGEWMMIELCRFITHKKNIHFKVLLETLSGYYCGSGGIYVEGIHFRTIDDANLKAKPNSDFVQQVSVHSDEITLLELEDDEKLFSPSEANFSNCHLLPAKMVLSNVKGLNWISRDEPKSRFLEAPVELLSHQVFQIKCKIETQKLSADTQYACYLVFKLSETCHGLQCPVKVRDVILRKKKEFKFLYFRSPRVVNKHNIERVPKFREDGLMEVVVWEFNSGNKQSGDDLPMSLKLRCYEGTLSGLIVYGIEFRPI